MVLMVDFFALCTCPPVWHGVVPPSCLVHNRPGLVWTSTTTTGPVTKKKRKKRRK